MKKDRKPPIVDLFVNKDSDAYRLADHAYLHGKRVNVTGMSREELEARILGKKPPKK